MKAHTPLSKQPAPDQSRGDWSLSAVRYLWHRAQEVNLLQMASNLTFNTVLAIVPLLAVVLALFTAFPHFHDFSDALQSFMAQNLMPASLSNSVMEHLNEFAAQASRLTAIGGAFLILTVMLLIMSIDSALNSIWHISKQRTIAQRLLVYWALITLGPILMGASLWVSAYLARESLGLVSEIPPMLESSLKLLPVIIGGLGFTALFIIVPNCKVRRMDALIGGFLSAGLIEAMKFAFGYYVSQFSTYAIIYGAFAALPVFLLWVYMSWLGVLSGALVTSAMPALRNGRLETCLTPGAQLVTALSIIQILSQSRGQIPSGQTEQALLDQTRQRPEELGQTLSLLAGIGWIVRSSDSKDTRWVLACDPSNVKLGALFDKALLDRQALDMREQPALEQALGELFTGQGDPLLQDVLLHHDKKPSQPIQSEKHSSTAETHHA